MNTQMRQPFEIINEMEFNAPDVFIRCTAPISNKKGKVADKGCILNLRTGDVFIKRKLSPAEQPNHRLVRKYRDYSIPNDKDVIVFSYQEARVIDEGVALITWAFADYVNYPETAHLLASWSYDFNMKDFKEGEKHDDSAVMNITLAQPQIAAIAVVNRDKEVLYWEDVERYSCKSKWMGDDCRWLAGSLERALFNSSDARRVNNMQICFKQYFDVGYIGANKYVVFDSHKDIPLFMRAAKLTMKSGPKQEIVNTLTEIKLPNHEDQIAELAKEELQTVCFGDRANEEYAVLRWFVKASETKYVETSRMYVNKKDAVCCRSDLVGHWVSAITKIKAESFKADRVVMSSDDVFDGTKLEYFKNISTELDNQSSALYMLTVYPEFEKMYKAGLEWLCNNYLSNPYQTSWKGFIDYHCGEVDWKAKSVNKMLGVNSHQIAKITEMVKRLSNKENKYWCSYYINSAIKTMKNMFCTQTLNGIDNKTFDFIVDSIQNSNRLTGNYISAVARTFDMYGKDAIFFLKDLNAISNGNQAVEGTDNYGRTTHMSIDTMYSDLIRMIQSGDYMNVIRPRFSSVEELASHHQIMVDLINADRTEHQRRQTQQHESKFNEYQSRWKKWEWSDDTCFCVIAPTKPLDLAEEGITLHHCVKSFIPSVACGETNIMFIRKKGMENVPFFTVEIDNYNSIRQIHGAYNCNVSTVGGLSDFVAKWAKAKKLKYSAQSSAHVLAAARRHEF